MNDASLSQSGPESMPHHTQGQHPAAGVPTGDTVLATLADLESRLGALKQAHTQSAARAEELIRREAELAQREQSLGQRERGLGDREAGLESRLAEFRDTAAQVAAQQEKMRAIEQSLEQQRRQIEQVREQLEKDEAVARDRERERHRRDEETSGRERAVSEREQQVNARGEGLTRLEHELTQQRESLARSRAELDRLESQARERDAAAEKRDHEQAAARRQFEQWAAARRDEIEKTASELEDRERAIALRSAALDERERAIDAREKACAQRERAVQEAAQAAERTRSDLDDRSKALAAQQAGLAAERSRVEQMRSELDEQGTRIEQEQGRVAALKAEVEELRREFEERRSLFEHEADVTRSSLEKREQDVRTLEEEIDRQRQSVKEKLDELDRERAAVNEQQRTLLAHAHNDQGSSAISSGRVEMLQIQIGEANAARASAEEALAQARDECGTLRAKLTELETRAGGAELEDEIAKRDHAIMVLRDKVRQLQAMTQPGRTEPNEAGTQTQNGKKPSRKHRGEAAAGVEPPAVGPGSLAWIEMRRRRLARFKTLLQQQARKVVAAQAALQKRHSECDQVFAQRSRLAQLAQDLARKEKRLALAKARSGAMVGVIAGVLAMGVCGAGSWFVAKRVFPGQYIARATIEADTHGRAADASELASWQRYHDELITNPQMMDVAAERMERRGIASLARPAALGAKLQSDLYTQSPQPGVMTLEIKESSPQKAEMVLDTFVTALKSVSDAAREQRADDLGVKIVQTSQADGRPLNESTLMGYAGGIFGGALLGVGLFGMLVWSRLVNAKKKFDQSLAVEEALSEVDWDGLEQSVRRASDGIKTGRASEPASPAKPAKPAKKRG